MSLLCLALHNFFFLLYPSFLNTTFSVFLSFLSITQISLPPLYPSFLSTTFSSVFQTFFIQLSLPPSVFPFPTHCFSSLFLLSRPTYLSFYTRYSLLLFIYSPCSLSQRLLSSFPKNLLQHLISGIFSSSTHIEFIDVEIANWLCSLSHISNFDPALWSVWTERWRIEVEVTPSGILSLSAQRRRCRTSQLQDRVQETPLSPLFLNVMHCVRVSLWTVKIFLAHH